MMNNKFMIDLCKPITKFVSKNEYILNIKSEKDRNTVNDLINRGVLLNITGETTDFTSFSFRDDSYTKLVSILRYYKCNKIYMGEFDFNDMTYNNSHPFNYNSKEFELYGCKITVIPYMEGILPIKDKQ